MISAADGCGQVVGGNYDIVLTAADNDCSRTTASSNQQSIQQQHHNHNDHDHQFKHQNQHQPQQQQQNPAQLLTTNGSTTDINRETCQISPNNCNNSSNQHQQAQANSNQQQRHTNSSPSVSSSAGSAVPHFGRVLTNYLERFEQLELQLEEAIRAGQLANCDYANEFRLLKEVSKKLRENKENLREGELDVNQIKNRYKDIIPFSHTRVSLIQDQSIYGSDYINANYIRGASGSPQAYIACQGPLPGTLIDFWRMIWECRVSVLVMACNEFESGKSKCEIYWPQELNSTINYGPYEIRLLRVRQICQDFLVRKFSIRLLKSQLPLPTTQSEHHQPSPQQHNNFPLLINQTNICPTTASATISPPVGSLVHPTASASSSQSSSISSSASSSLSSNKIYHCHDCNPPNNNHDNLYKLNNHDQITNQAHNNNTNIDNNIVISNNLNINSDTCRAGESIKMQISPPSTTVQQQSTGHSFDKNMTKNYVTNKQSTSQNDNNNTTNENSEHNPDDDNDDYAETRIICQFHYTTWPDHGAPRSMQPILEMVRLMREVQPAEDRPILVHCSAGCGRTGTICCIDYVWGLLRRGELEPSFDLCSIIYEMRQQRMAMVQTLEQYILCHRAVAALFIDQLRLIDDHTYENLDDLGPLDAVEAASRAEPSAVVNQQQNLHHNHHCHHKNHLCDTNYANAKQSNEQENHDTDNEDDSSYLLSDDDLTGPVFI